MSVRRGGIPGPESRTGLVRPAMSEAEFERQQAAEAAATAARSAPPVPPTEAEPPPRSSTATASASAAGRGRGRARPARARRVQRMFAIEEDLDKKLWLYAIHVGKDRSEVVNDLLRPLVASMVLYDSRDRRSGRSSPEPAPEEQGVASDDGER